MIRTPFRIPLLLAALSAAGGCAPAGGQTTSPPSPATTGTARLEALIDSVTTTAPLHRTRWGIEVRDAATGDPILLRNTEKLFTAASNAKIAVVITALDLLGPEYRYTTRVEAPGGQDGVAEALIVRASADPSFSSHFHDDPLAPLDSLADSLVAAGLRRVDGPLVVDASRFDSIQVHPAWETYDLDWYYAAPVAPFAVMEAAIPVVITPGAVGSRARVEALTPPGLVRLDAEVRTVSGTSGWNDELRRVPGEDALVLRGTIGAERGPDTSWIAQDDPNRFAGRALAHALESRGVDVGGPVVVRYDGPWLQGWPDGGAVRASWTSPPLAPLVRISLEESDNWVTEMILRTLGAELRGDAGWSASTAVVEEHLAGAADLEDGSTYLRDGSGLSQQTLFTPHALASLLLYARDRPWSELFRSALAAPGEEDGTLEDRLLALAGRVEAKTGTIRHVNSLSGYARSIHGRDLVFSILTNASGRPAREVQRAIDRILEAIIHTDT